jgi:hypothetical protein
MADGSAPRTRSTVSRTAQPGGNRRMVSSARSATVAAGRRLVRCRMGGEGGERDVHRAVLDRAQVSGGPGQRLAQLDDDTRMAVPQVSEGGAEVERAGAEGAAQDDGAADLTGDRRDLVAGRLHGIEDALGGGLQGRAVLGNGDRRDRPVEQGHAEFMLEAGDGAGHGRLDDVDLTGGPGEAPRLAAG